MNTQTLLDTLRDVQAHLTDADGPHSDLGEIIDALADETLIVVSDDSCCLTSADDTAPLNLGPAVTALAELCWALGYLKAVGAAEPTHGRLERGRSSLLTALGATL